MVKEVKIVRFQLEEGDIRKAEKELTELVSQGWQIVTAGGGGGGYGGGGSSANDVDPWGVIVNTGFVVLEKA
jgi:hypothetical protein